MKYKVMITGMFLFFLLGYGLFIEFRSTSFNDILDDCFVTSELETLWLKDYGEYSEEDGFNELNENKFALRNKDEEVVIFISGFEPVTNVRFLFIDYEEGMAYDKHYLCTNLDRDEFRETIRDFNYKRLMRMIKNIIK